MKVIDTRVFNVLGYTQLELIEIYVECKTAAQKIRQ
jgi:hypothetical protein